MVVGEHLDHDNQGAELIKVQDFSQPNADPNADR
jgi:hypothetical protein